MNSEQMLQDMLMAQETENVQKATHSLADDMVVQTDRETPMTVGQVIECTKAWVSIQAEQRPGVLGAHLMGGITLMALDEYPFRCEMGTNERRCQEWGSGTPVRRWAERSPVKLAWKACVCLEGT